jgi:hypothetical protein
MTSLSSVLDAVRQVESGGNRMARSSAGAMGPYQFMPATAREYGLKNPYDEQESRGAAERKLTDLLTEYDGDMPMALAAYNAGQGNLRKVGNDYSRIPETRNYVRKVLGALNPISTAQADEDPGDWVDEPQGGGEIPLAGLNGSQAATDDPGDWVDEPKAGAQPVADAQPLGDLSSGIKRGLDKKLTGLQQVGSEVARIASGELGSDPSEYRRGVDEQARRLIAESKGAPMLERAGENVLDAVISTAIPLARGGGSVGAIASRVGQNAATGGGLAFINPYESESDRANATAQGALLGAAIPEGLGAITGAARGVRSHVGNAQAARQMAKQLESKFGSPTLSLEMPPTPAAVRGEAGANFTGPPQPRFGFVQGVEPTAAMLYQGNPQVMELEKVARSANAQPFYQRDIANTEAVADAIKGRSIDAPGLRDMKSALNAKTQPIKDTALRMASDPVLSKALGSATGRPADDVSKFVDSVYDLGSEGQVARMAKQYLDETHATPEDLYKLRKTINDKLKSSATGDLEANAIKDARRVSMGIKSAIDDALNDASGGLWSTYLKEHAKGEQSIGELKAFAKILGDMDTKALTPNGRPNITPAALRQSADRNTWTQLGELNYADKLSGEGRLMLSDAIDTLNAMEAAKTGVKAVTGSNTPGDLLSVAKNVPLIRKGANVLDVLKNATSGQTRLSNALLNPTRGDLERIIAEYERLGQPAPRWLRRAYATAGAAASSAGR